MSTKILKFDEGETTLDFSKAISWNYVVKSRDKWTNEVSVFVVAIDNAGYRICTLRYDKAEASTDEGRYGEICMRIVRSVIKALDDFAIGSNVFLDIDEVIEEANNKIKAEEAEKQEQKTKHIRSVKVD